MKNARSKNTATTTQYTATLCAEDVLKLVSVIGKELEVLTRCVACSSPAIGSFACDYSADDTALFGICAECHTKYEKQMPKQALDSADWITGYGSALPIPKAEADRLQLTRQLFKLLCCKLHDNDQLPVLMRPLHVFDVPMEWGLVIFQQGNKLKTHALPVPWCERDPFLVGGKFARDTVAVLKSILTGKTSHFDCLGNSILTSHDSQLFKVLANPRGEK